MAANYETNAIITARINQLVAALRDPSFCTQLRLDFLSENPYQNGVWYQFSHKVSFTSWGEDVTLSLTSIDDHTTRVAIRSECSMPTQIIDWGKNKQVVQKICEYLQANAPRYPINQPMPQPMPQPAPQPQYQQPPQPQTAPSFCSRCGTRLTTQGAFCPTCGHQVR